MAAREPAVTARLSPNGAQAAHNINRDTFTVGGVELSFDEAIELGRWAQRAKDRKYPPPPVEIHEWNPPLWRRILRLT